MNTRPGDANCTESFETSGTREVSTTADEVSDVNRSRDSAIVTPNLKKLENESTVSAAKKKDLLWMCDELIIPKDYHQFYRDLSVIGTEKRSTDASDTGTAVVVDATEANVCSVPDATGVRTRSSIASDVNKTRFLRPRRRPK